MLVTADDVLVASSTGLLLKTMGLKICSLLVEVPRGED